MLVLTACQKSGTEPAKTETVKETEGKVASENGELILATTTSTKDSGLLDEILPAFEEETRYRVSVVSVGSGEAMKMGENGKPMCCSYILRQRKKPLLKADMPMKTEEKMLCITTM